MDISKVSGAVQAKVQEIITKDDGDENITKKEYAELGQYFNGLKGTEERAYVQSFMEAYEDGTKNNAISDGAKELVKKIKALWGEDPNAIDSETEATALKEELKDPSWGEEDKAYFARQLAKSEYGKGGVGWSESGNDDKKAPSFGRGKYTPDINKEKLEKIRAEIEKNGNVAFGLNNDKIMRAHSQLDAPDKIARKIAEIKKKQESTPNDAVD